uniref:Uncharacterized protein n=1 Tax=Rhizophora mucronata TaxID=61149 RepID=A0A2P2QVF0_RHIMU
MILRLSMLDIPFLLLAVELGMFLDIQLVVEM